MPLINCPRCGRQISNRAVQCPECGFQFPPNTGTFSRDALTHKVIPICPECGSHDVFYTTAKEPIPLDMGTVILYIVLALTCCGLFVLIPILLSPKERTVTYATCKTCGYHWNTAEHNMVTNKKIILSKENKKKELIIGVLSIVISLAIIIVCILVYNNYS
ncbi:zinc ribbon domain-containing protein [Eisenbergiella porci]|uniref:zinc ribbon domain-containing protein n=1 Tax=Eisenbergiella porci TaxID=2652274 RepID=UPI002A832A96|nr:zinc ribbon domain-containing protein [Eisenbergiella porci]